MSKNIGYIRISTDNQDLKNQKHSILDYCNSKRLGSINFIEVKLVLGNLTKIEKLKSY
jgi:DNA invertase Pin-like site-specific DNA recombinase